MTQRFYYSPASPSVVTLQSALRDHDAVMIRNLEGVTESMIDRRRQGWLLLGIALGRLALRTGETCRACALGAAWPEPVLIAQRLAEALDDQIDAPDWRIVEAAARWRAQGPRR